MYLVHHGVKGQKWGIRRYQNEDGSLTPEGRRHYNIGERGELIPKDKNFDPLNKKDISKMVEKEDPRKGLTPGQKAAIIGGIAAGSALLVIGGTAIYLGASGKGKEIVSHLKLGTSNIDLTDVPIGKLDTPMPIATKNKTLVNPFMLNPFSYINRGCLYNCVNCAVATDMRSKGYDVSARPNPIGMGEGLFEKIYGKSALALSVKNITGPIGSKAREESAKTLFKKAIEQISEGDDYAHGILVARFNSVALPSSISSNVNVPIVGHAINWVKENGEIKFIDNQSIGSSSGLKYMFKNIVDTDGDFLIGDARPSLIRTDNANINWKEAGISVLDRKTMLDNALVKSSLSTIFFKNRKDILEDARHPNMEELILKHHGIEGQKWGKRRWQYADGSLTPEGRIHYGYMDTDVYRNREAAFNKLDDMHGLKKQAFKTRMKIGYSTGHYTRNMHNQELPKNDADAEKMGWRKLSAKESAMHQNNRTDGVANSKWVSPDGHSEVVFTGKGRNQHRTTDVRDEGTYNFRDPQKNPVGHAFKDVIPYVFLGNSANDPTTIVSRITGSANAFNEKDIQVGEEIVEKVLY